MRRTENFRNFHKFQIERPHDSLISNLLNTMDQSGHVASQEQRKPQSNHTKIAVPFLFALLWLPTSRSFTIGQYRIRAIHSSVSNRRSMQLSYRDYGGLDAFDNSGNAEESSHDETEGGMLRENDSKSEQHMEHVWKDALENLFSSPSTLALRSSGVSASVLPMQGHSSPLVLTPDGDSSSEFLRSFLNSHKKWVEEYVHEYGAVVFRGFGDETNGSSDTAAIYEELLGAIGSNKGSQSSSLDVQKGFESYLVFEQSNPGISQKYSLERIQKSPTRLFKISDKARFVDWRRIHDDLPPKIRRKLCEKHLLYKRRDVIPAPEMTIPLRSVAKPCSSGFVSYRATPLQWSRLFGSTSTNTVERAYRQAIAAIALQIYQENKATFVDERRFLSEAFRRHPHTNEIIWFERAHTFHWTSKLTKLLKESGLAKNLWRLVQASSVGLWQQLLCIVGKRSRQKRSKSTTKVTFGDGTPIAWWEILQILRAIHKNTVQYPLKPGDFLMVDGLSLGLQ